MNDNFWRERWREGRIGFHEGKPNDFLVEHLERLGRRVLVPLCGKSEDLAYLAAHGREVIGVELVEDAVRAFFREHGIEPAVSSLGGLRSLTHGGITLLAGDFFAASLPRAVDSFYDRAALIALPPDLRARYVTHLRALAGPGAKGLLISLEYDPARMSGPPFSVPENEVRTHYAGALVESLDSRPDPRPREFPVVERCYSLTLP